MSQSNEYHTHPGIEVIRNSALGRELTDAECETFAKLVTTRVLTAGDLLFKRGECDHMLYVIGQGSLKAVNRTATGEALDLYDLHTGEFAGIMGFMDGLGHTADLQAISDATVFSLPRANFDVLAKQEPELAIKVMRAIIRTVLSILQRMDVQFAELTNYVSKQHGRY